ncbi:MAG: transporter associated domain-containing protein, partial [Brevinematia bacterium]
LSTIIISVLITVFGEILPKVGGYTIAERMVLIVAKIVYFINTIGKPIFRFVDTSIIYPFMKNDFYTSRFDRVELIEIIKRNIKNDKLRNIIDVFSLDAKDMMIPISNVNLVSIDGKDIQKSLEKINTFSRYIFVYEENLTNIVGVVKIEKLLSYAQNKSSVLSKYLEPVNFAPETKKIYDLVIELKNKNLEVSVVIDEYGNIIGVITPEIIFNHIFKVGISKFTKVSKEKFIVNGDTSLKEFNESFQTDLESKFYNTISGFVIEKLGKIPNKGDIIKLPNITMEIENVKNGKIESIIVKLNSKL